MRAPGLGRFQNRVRLVGRGGSPESNHADVPGPRTDQQQVGQNLRKTKKAGKMPVASLCLDVARRGVWDPGCEVRPGGREEAVPGLIRSLPRPRQAIPGGSASARLLCGTTCLGFRQMSSDRGEVA